MLTTPEMEASKLGDFSSRSKLAKKPGAQLEMTCPIKAMRSSRLIPIANRLNSQENVSRFPCGLLIEQRSQELGKH